MALDAHDANNEAENNSDYMIIWTSIQQDTPRYYFLLYGKGASQVAMGKAQVRMSESREDIRESLLHVLRAHACPKETLLYNNI